jgi:hypothetical protein
MRSFIIGTNPKISFRQVTIKENEMGGACGTHGRGEKMYMVLVGQY